jgi:hypothetical protein
MKHASSHNQSIKLALPKYSGEQQEFNIDIQNPKGVHFDLCLKWKFNLNRSVNYRYSLNILNVIFRKFHMKEIINEYNAFDLGNIDLTGSRGDCLRAQHTISGIYNCEVLHVPAIQWSSVRILSRDKSKSLTTSNLIGSAQLPSKSQIEEDSPYIIDLDPQLEKAMLVKNVDSDFAIVKGKWVGFKRGVAPAVGNSIGERGSPGQLSITILFVKEFNLIFEKLELKLDLSESFLLI